MKFNKALKLIVLVSLSSGAFANDDLIENDLKRKFSPPKNQFGKSIYPFVPVSTAHLKQRVRIMSEDKNFIQNFNEIISRKLSKRNTQNAVTPGAKPWMSTYWPLQKGLVADPYKSGGSLRRLDKELLWKGNYKRLIKRQNTVQKNWRELDNEQLETLAPSEKYDILLGDENFTLTKKVVKYMHDWGTKKENAFLSKMDKVGANTWQLANNYMQWGWLNGDNIPYQTADEAYPLASRLRGGLTDEIAKHLLKKGQANSLESALSMAKPMAIAEQKNYILKPASKTIATWEGICHGWSTAAGNVPRPRKTVTFTLDNGKTLKFYPDDLKALASYMWANSLIQDSRNYDAKTDSFSGGGILMEGLRCNDRNADHDPWGRVYDKTPDDYSKELEPRCVGVHPAIWHLGLVNIIGKQGRSFIVERKISEAVDNHPMYGYKATYFNPYTGEYDGSVQSKVKKITAADQFKAFRNPEATHIVGVKLSMTYINWKRPTRAATDSESKDSEKTIDMLYDLELDASGNIVGGQWRTIESGKPKFLINKKNRKQPDFFWSVTKTWKNYFRGRTDLPEWKDGLPPSEYKAASVAAANQLYYSTPQYNWYDRCTIKRDKKTKLNKKLPKEIRVNCEHIYEKPQPLIQVVNKLIDMAK